MFNLSFGELIVLGGIGLIFLGPKQLPQIAKVLGRLAGQLKKAMNEVKSTVSTELTKDTFHTKDSEKEDPKKPS